MENDNSKDFSVRIDHVGWMTYKVVKQDRSGKVIKTQICDDFPMALKTRDKFKAE